MIDGNQGWYLQCAGRLVDENQTVRPRPIGRRVFLQPGTLLDDGSGLGLTNHDLISLPADLLGSQWLLEAYQLWDEPDGGQVAGEWLLNQPVLMHHLQLEALPPCAFQPALQRQPRFELRTTERNPCPGWSERIHLYNVPGKPFEASAIIYLNGNRQVAAAELFNISLRETVESMQVFPRRWIQFTY